MNRGRKGSGNNRVDEDIPDELRCKRSDGKQWRCNARAMENKTLCEKHYNQAKKRASGATANSSPKKKTKTKDGVSPDVLHLGRAASSFADTRNKVASRALMEGDPRMKPSRMHSSTLVAASDYRHSNYRHADHRLATNDYKLFRDSSNGRQGLERQRIRRSPGRDSYFKDEAMHPPDIFADEDMDQQIDLCHQCRKNDRGELICCLKCGKKHYCQHCISRWYPDMHEDDFRQACPHCRGNCNCKVCVRLGWGGSMFPEMKVVSDFDKVKYLKYMLSFIQPLLQQLHQEQCEEVDLEVTLTGDASLKAERSKLMKDERLYCDNCTTSIVDLYRSCLTCGYDLCITCCRELRRGQQPGGEHAGTAEKPSIARVKGSSKGSLGANEISLPAWGVNGDSSIPCPPSERGGCGSSTLILKRVLKSNSIAKMAEANIVTALDQKPPHLLDASCACRVDPDTASTSMESVQHLRRAAYRTDSKDNYVYCPTTQAVEKEGLNHFQKHWLRGEPMIIRNVLEETQGVSWDPLIIWRAFRESTKSKSMVVLDCLNWCPAEISINQFFKGYNEGRLHKNGWPEMLKTRDFPHANFLEERLPRHGARLISALPFHEYINTRHGILNLASKVPDDCLRPDYGPRVNVAYGMREELERGDSVTKLHYDMCDTVNVLMHTAEVERPGWQISRLDKYRTLYKKIMAANPSLDEAVRLGDQSAGAKVLDKVVRSGNEGLDAVKPPSSSSSHEDRTVSMFLNGTGSVKEEDQDVASGKEEGNRGSALNEVKESSQHELRTSWTPEAILDRSTEIKKTSFQEPLLEGSDNQQLLVTQKKDAMSTGSTLMGEGQSPNRGGVLWDVFRREDVSKVHAYLSRHSHEFTHINEDYLDQVIHPIHDQTFYLTKEHKKKLKDEWGVEPWTFEQHLGEAVFIPAGCPYQTRNLKSCINAVLDFVSPENIQELVRLSEEFRLLPKGHGAKDDKLEARKLMLYAANRTTRDIKYLTGSGDL